MRIRRGAYDLEPSAGMQEGTTEMSQHAGEVEATTSSSEREPRMRFLVREPRMRSVDTSLTQAELVERRSGTQVHHGATALTLGVLPVLD